MAPRPRCAHLQPARPETRPDGRFRQSKGRLKTRRHRCRFVLGLACIVAGLSAVTAGVWITCATRPAKHTVPVKEERELANVVVPQRRTLPQPVAAPRAEPTSAALKPATGAPALAAVPAPKEPSAALEKARVRPVPFKRIDPLSEDELRAQLLKVPVAALDRVPNTSTKFVLTALSSRGASYPGPQALLADRPDLSGLPFGRGNDCYLDKQKAEDLGELARSLRGHIRSCTSVEGTNAHAYAAALRSALAEPRNWTRAEALPALLQMLQAEPTPVRALLVDLLAVMPGPRPTGALAVRALVDVSPDARQAAVRALAARPAKEYRKLLLSGFRYPWPPVAAHAAEALVALGDRGAIPMLEALLEEPPPGMPSPAIAGVPGSVGVRELVRVNHLSNCLLCHAPSFKKDDRVRGVVPVPGRSPITEVYYDGTSDDVFVRADVTYLRQDFSLMQPVVVPHKNWPTQQRFDFAVRVRPPSDKDLALAPATKAEMISTYRKPIIFALRELQEEGGP